MAHEGVILVKIVARCERAGQWSADSLVRDTVQPLAYHDMSRAAEVKSASSRAGTYSRASEMCRDPSAV
eukprot:6181045-Pleurochrysis_carterae.AAC.1